MRIIYVPQYPTSMRYSEWWYWKLPQMFEDVGYEVITLGKSSIRLFKNKRANLDMFSPVSSAINFEIKQIEEYMLLNIKKDDVLFLNDLSFPGLFCNILYHKQCTKMFAFCHATSLNKFDYFENVRNSKFLTESGHSVLFDKVFVGSEYHKQKLINGSNLKLWTNTKVSYLPFPPFKPVVEKLKKYNIISVSRPTPQKVDENLEKVVENHFGPVNRLVSNSWKEYYKNLAMSKILLVTAQEDTFGYQIVDAIINGCIPIARNDLAYPELLPEEYLYNNSKELLERIENVLNGTLLLPKLKCEKQMKDFYYTIIKEIKGKNGKSD